MEGLWVVPHLGCSALEYAPASSWSDEPAFLNRCGGMMVLILSHARSSHFKLNAKRGNGRPMSHGELWLS